MPAINTIARPTDEVLGEALDDAPRYPGIVVILTDADTLMIKTNMTHHDLHRLLEQADYCVTSDGAETDA